MHVFPLVCSLVVIYGCPLSPLLVGNIKLCQMDFWPIYYSFLVAHQELGTSQSYVNAML